MRKYLVSATLAAAALAAAALPAQAAIDFFGTAKVKPTFYSNFDFDDSKPDAPTLNEGGWASGEHMRAELRLGWQAKGDNWLVKMIAEADVIMNKDNGDRSFYVGAEKNNQPNAGGEFGIERAEFLYTFAPQLQLETGWDIRFLDLKTGGLLYGDDHPFIGFRGKLSEMFSYEVLYMPIQNGDVIGTRDDWQTGDWRVYTAKVDATFDTGMGKFTVSPLAAYSDNEDKNVNVTYYGLEGLGQIGPVKPSFEIVAANGEFEDGGPDVKSWAAFAGLEVPVSKALSPYVAFRYARGDDDKSDEDVEGWLGITDIGRFTPLMGMDGNILGEHLASGASVYGASLYAYAPERAVGGNTYGGIGNAGSGNNPGQRLIAVGAKGDLGEFVPNLSYKAQAFFIWYDQTGNLTNVKDPGEDVDDYAGTTFDLQLAYKFNKNFSIDNIFSAFVPGQGIEDQVDANDTAWLNMLTLAWTY
ncbi:porin [Deferrisoma palaeochoriense]